MWCAMGLIKDFILISNTLGKCPTLSLLQSLAHTRNEDMDLINILEFGVWLGKENKFQKYIHQH